MSTDRASCWSITQQIDTEEDGRTFMSRQLPPGWKLQGQVEKAPSTGKLHLQLLLKTPQVRFSAVKKIFTQAHIEQARDERALAIYVHKEESRVRSVEHTATPTLWDFNTMVLDKWDCAEFEKFAGTTDWRRASDEMAMLYVDKLIGDMIESGVRGAEYMGVNPMIRSSWKKFWKQMVYRQIYKAMRTE